MTPEPAYEEMIDATEKVAVEEDNMTNCCIGDPQQDCQIKQHQKFLYVLR